MNFKPTPEELQNPHRTIRVFKRLIDSYQREHAANFRRVKYLHDIVCGLLELPKTDFETASGRRIRHDLGTIGRRVTVIATKMQNSRMNLRRGPAAATESRTTQSEKDKKAVKRAIENLVQQFSDAWNWSAESLARTLNERASNGIDPPYRTRLYSQGRLARVIGELKKERI